jgi:hypothetical protein
MEPESAERKKRVRKRRTHQPFKTKRYKFSEDSYLYYWEAIILVSLIILFFIAVILFLNTFLINYKPPAEAKPTPKMLGTLIKSAVAKKCFTVES